MRVAVLDLYRGQALVKKSGRSQDYGLLNRHSPDPRSHSPSFLQSFAKNNVEVVSYLFTVIFHLGTVCVK